RDAVGDRDRGELDRDGAALPNALFRERRKLVQVVVARRHLVPGRRHGDLRLAEVLLREPHSTQHGTGRRSLGTFGDLPAARAVVCHVGGLLEERVRGTHRTNRGERWSARTVRYPPLAPFTGGAVTAS